MLTRFENTSVSDLIGKFFPNPSSDIINIPLNEFNAGEVILNVFDTYGKEVKKESGQPQQYGKNIFQFSVEDLLSGLYFYSIIGQNKHYHGKFTVNR